MSKRWLVVVAMVLGALCIGSDAGAQARPSITIKLRNDARAPVEVIAPAQRIVSHMYDAAGVDVSWEGAPTFTVVLSADEIAGLSHRRDVLGFATGTPMGRGKVAYIMTQRVEDIAGGSARQRAVVLGAAIAHEVGHLLLPYNTHSDGGIMRPVFDRNDFRNAECGNLRFTADQAVTIRAAVETVRGTARAQVSSTALP